MAALAAAETTAPAVDPGIPPAIVREPGDPLAFAAGDTVVVTVTFDAEVTVTGSPRIKLDIGGVERYAAFGSADGSVLRFRYVVQGGDEDADGLDIVADSLELNGGSIRGGNAGAVLDHPTQAAPDTRRPVDGVVPMVKLVGSVTGFLGVESLLTVVLAFSESVSGVTEGDLVVSNGSVEDLGVEEFIGLPNSVYSFLVDPAGEGPLTVTLPAGAALDGAGNGNAASTELRVLVGDPATVGIVARTSNTAEGQAVEFRVERSKANGERTLQVQVSEDGHYLAGGTSFGPTISATPVTVPVTFAATETVVTISLDTDDDLLDEEDGSVTAALLPDPTEVGYLVGFLGAASALVRDNDAPLALAAYAEPAVARAGVPATEVIEGDPITFTLVRSRDAGAQTLDVEITQAGGYLADSHPDGLALPENGRIQVEFPAEVRAASFTLNTAGDTEHNDDGSVTLTVLDRPHDPGYPSTLGAPAAIAVRDNDAPPTVTAASVAASVTEGSLIRVNVQRTTGPYLNDDSLPVEVELTAAGGMVPGTFPQRHVARLRAGASSTTIYWPAVDNQVAEATGNFTARILPPGSAHAGRYLVGARDTASVAVLDNEDPEVTVAAVAATVTEGDDALYRITRLGSVAESLTVWIDLYGHYKTMSDATRALAENTGLGPDTTVTLAAGAVAATLTVSTEADLVNEGDGELRAVIKNTRTYEIGGSGSATVLVEDDDIPEVSLNWLSPALTLEDNVWVGEIVEGTEIDYELECSGNTLAPSARWEVRVVAEHQEILNHPRNPRYDRYERVRHPCAGHTVGWGWFRDGWRRYTGPDNGEITVRLQPQELEVDGIGGRCYLDSQFGTTEDLRFCPKYTLGGVTSARIAVLNRNPTVVVEAVDEEVDEGEPARFKLTRIWNAENLSPIGGYETAFDFTMSAAGDYATGALPAGPRTFGVAQTEIVIEVPTMRDGVRGADGSVSLEILPGSPEAQARNTGGSYEVYDQLPGITAAGKSSRAATVTVVNIDDYPLLYIPDASAEEGYKLEFVATLSEPHDKEISVDWSVMGGTARVVDDYSIRHVSGSLTFAAGDIKQRFTIQTVEDRIPEATETFNVKLSNAVQVGLPAGPVTATITDNDLLPVVTIAPVRSPVEEGIHPRFVVTRQGLAERLLGVDLAITLDGDDHNTRRVWMQAGESSVTTRVRHRDNDDVEDDYVYAATVQVSTATPATYVVGTPDSASVTVRDDDTTRLFSIVSGPDPKTFSEAGEVIKFQYYLYNEGSVASEAPVMLHSAQLGPLLVSDTTVPANSETVVLANYTITEQDVTTGYVHERFYVDDGRTRSSYGGFLVHHEDKAYRYSVRAPHSLGLPARSDDENNGHIPVWIVRTDTTPGSHVVRYYTQDQTAKGRDYTAVAGTLTFPDSDAPYYPPRVVNVPVTDDDLDEPDEYFEMVVVDNDDHADVLARGYITIDDDDPPVVPRILNNYGDAMDEGGPAQYGPLVVTVRIVDRDTNEAHLSGHTVEVSYETVDGTAKAGEDYTHVSGRLTIRPGHHQWRFEVPIIDDAIDEPALAEDFSIVLSEAVNMEIPSDRGTHTIKIQDNDDAPSTISLSAAPAEVGEAAGPTDITVTAAFATSARTEDTELKVQAGDGTAEAGSDYTAVPEFALTIPANQLTGTAAFTFTPIDDAVPEAALETVTISGLADGFMVTPVASPGLQIRDDDVREVVVDPSALTIREGKTANYSVALATRPAGNVVVGAAAPAASITVEPPSLTFKANDWSTAQTVTVTAASDADAEDERATVSHTVAGADYAAAPAAGVSVTVVDDETPSKQIGLAIGGAVAEGGGDQEIGMHLRLDNAPLRVDTTVRVAIGGGTATPGDDFAALDPIDVTIPAGEKDVLFNVTLSPVDDDVDEEDETLSFSGQVVADGVPVAGGLPVTGADVAIVDDDTRGVEISDTALTVEEGTQTIYTVRLTSAPAREAALQVAVAANADLQASPTHHYFSRANWNDARTVRITAHADADLSDDEVTVTHAVTGGDYDGLAVEDVAVTVTEPVTTGVSVQDARGSEGSGALEFVVSLDRAIKVEGKVSYHTAAASASNGVTAMAGQDFTAVASTPLTFAAGETRQTVRIELLDDARNEAEEHLELDVLPDILLLTPGETPAPVSVRGTIVDDDPLPVLKVTGSGAAGWSRGPESAGSLKYKVILSPASSREVTVEYATGNRAPGARFSGLNTATASEDYTPLSGTLTFAPGDTGRSLTVALNDDAVSEGDEVFALQLQNPRFALLSNHGFGLIRDEDERGLVRDPLSLTVNEGATGTYTIALSSQPTAAVSVALTASAGVTVEPALLQFAIDGWLAAQTVTVTARQDADAVDGRATVSPAVSGGDYEGLRSADVTVTVLDDETQGIVPSPESLTVAEGGDATWTVALASEPASDVTVAIGGTIGSDLNLDRSTLTFTPQDWQDTQTVKVTADQDHDASPDTVRLSHVASGGDYVSVRRELPVTVTDDDTAAPELTVVLGEPEHDDQDASGTVTLGDVLSYTARGSNTGNVALSGVELSDLLVNSTGKECGAVAIGGNCEISGEYAVTQADVDAGMVENTATGNATELSGEVTASRSTAVEQERELTLAKSAAESGFGGTGETLTYSYEVSNSGTVTLTGTVSITDDKIASEEISCGTVPTGGLGPGGKVTCSGSYETEQADVDGSGVTNSATASLGGVESEAVEVRVPWQAPQGQTPRLTVNGAGGSEDAGTLEVTVTLSPASVQTVRVGYATGDVTAEAGADYTAATGTLTLLPGATAGTIAVRIADDAEDEEAETFTVSLSDAVNATVGTGTTTITIADNDTRGVTVSPTSLPVAEGGDATYSVVLDSAPTGEVTVTPTVTGSSDVTVSEDALTFTTTTWSDEQTVTVSAAQDADAEDDTATVTHTVAGADYGDNSVTADSVSVTVGDDETASTEVELTVSPESVGEADDATTVTVTATLNDTPRTTDATITVTVGDAGDAAAEGTDYATVGTVTVTITAGQTTGTESFSLDPTDDDVDEADERLSVKGSTTATGLSVSSTTVTIEDDDTRGVTVVPTSVPVAEGGDATYSVVLDSAPTGEVTVTPNVTGSSDVTVSDEVLTFTTTTWSDEQTVTVSAAADDDAEDDTATVTHTVAGADYGDNSVTADSVSVTVDDDETASTEVALTVSPESVAEADDATTVTVTATLNDAPRTTDTMITVTVGDASDPATEGADYATVGTVTVTITAGQKSGTETFSLDPTDDDVDEADERLSVKGSTTATGLSVSSTTVTIEDDDTRGVTVAPTSLPVAEGRDATYTVVLDSAPTGAVTVTPTVTGSSDVTVSDEVLTFTTTTWSDEQTVTVSAAADTDAEDDTATVTHTVAGADYEDNSVTADSVSVAVDDDETASTQVALTVSPESVAEADDATTVTVTATLNDAPRTSDTTVTVTVGSAGDPAAEGTDYTTVDTVTVTITAGQTSDTESFSLDPTGDDVDEADETLSVTGSTTAAGLVVTGTTVTIADDDMRRVTVAPTSLPVAEGGDATYTVVLDSAPTGEVTVTPNVTGSNDVTVSEDALTFTTTTWSNEQTVTVSAAQDADAEDDTATVTHTVAGADYGDNNVTADDVSVAVDDDDTAAPELTVVLGEPEHDDQDASGTVTLGDVLSYTARGSNTGNVALSGVELSDLLVNSTGKECGAVAIGGSCEISGEYPVTQADVDAGMVENTATGTATELSGEVTATRSTAVAQERKLTLAKSAAESGFGGTGETLTYSYEVSNSGTVTLTGTVSIADDKIASEEISCGTVTGGLGPGGKVTCSGSYETEQADVDGSGVTNSATASLGGVESEAVEVRVPWQAPQGQTPRLTVNGAGGSEDAGTLEVTVTLSPASVQTVQVGYATGDVTAVAGADYTAARGTLTLLPGATAGTIAVSIADDAEDEEAETFTVSLSDAMNATVGTGTTTITIADNDTRGVTVAPTSLPVAEGGDATYTVVLDSAPTGEVTVTPTVTGSSDVTVSEDALTFTTTTWSDEQTVTVNAAQDADAEDDTATVTHTVAGADYEDNSVTADSVSVTVNDDETASTEVELTVSPESVGEADDATTVTVTATLNDAPRTTDATITVTVGDAGDAAAEGTDYATVGTVTVTITAGQTTGTESFSLDPTDDDVDEADETLSVTGSTTATGLSVTGSTTATGLSVSSTTVTIEDDDTRGVTVAPTSLPVAEGGDMTYTVVLDSAPTGAVTVTLTVTGSSDVTVSEDALTFTTTTWADEQTVTVSAAADADAEDDTAAVGHVVAGADYGGNSVTADSVSVAVDDDETIFIHGGGAYREPRVGR